MRRTLTAISIILALLGASCGGEEPSVVDTVSELPAPSAPDRTAGTDGSDGSVDAATSGAESAVADQAGGASKALVLAAVEKSATNESVRMAMSMVMGGIPELGEGEASLVIEAAIGDGGRSSEFSMDLSGFIDAALAAPDLDPLEAELMRSMFAQPIRFKTIGDTSYVSASLLSFFVPAETTWIGFEGGQSAADLGMSDLTAAPADFLALLRGVDDEAEIVGTEMIDGVSTTHIHGRLSVLDAVAAAPESERAAVEEALAGLNPSDLVQMSVELFEIDVWIGDDDLVRRMVMSVDDLAALDETGETPPGAYMRMVFDFTDHGVPVVIEAPAPGDVTYLDESVFGLGA